MATGLPFLKPKLTQENIDLIKTNCLRVITKAL